MWMLESDFLGSNLGDTIYHLFVPISSYFIFLCLGCLAYKMRIITACTSYSYEKEFLLLKFLWQGLECSSCLGDKLAVITTFYHIHDFPLVFILTPLKHLTPLQCSSVLNLLFPKMRVSVS